MAEHMPRIIGEHVHRFERIEEQLQKAHEKIEELGAEMASVVSRQNDVRTDLYGNGQPGLLSTITMFMAEMRARDQTAKDDQTKAASKTSLKQNWIIAIASVILALAAYAALLRH